MNWTIDQAHSDVGFAVKHMGLATVRGSFKQFTGEGETDANGLPVSLSMTVEAASIFTNNEQRDAHLRSPDFFDAERYPQLVFKSTKIAGTRERLTIEGDLTIRGVTRPVTLRGALGPAIKDPWGNVRTSLSASGTIKRSEWGLTWNQVLEFGGLAVSDEVKITIEAEAVAVAEARAA